MVATRTTEAANNFARKGVRVNLYVDATMVISLAVMARLANDHPPALGIFHMIHVVESNASTFVSRYNLQD